jgi:heme A synthase
MRRLPLPLLARGTLVYNLAVIVWGAYVRASFSGNGCGEHWPLCNGQVIPHADNLKTLVELAHRATSGLALISVIVLAVAVWQQTHPGHPARRFANLAVVFMITEALLGATLVLFGLVNHDASPMRAVAMSLHLVNTLLLLAAIALTDLRVREAGRAQLSSQGLVGAVLITALVALPTLAVSGAIAALGDTLFPARTLAEGLAQDASPLASFLLRIRVAHPALALTTAVILLTGCWLSSLHEPPESPVREAAVALAALFLAQLGIGFLNLVLLAPVPLQLVHLLLADLVWVALVRLAARALSAPGRTLSTSEVAPWPQP